MAVWSYTVTEHPDVNTPAPEEGEDPDGIVETTETVTETMPDAEPDPEGDDEAEDGA